MKKKDLIAFFSEFWEINSSKIKDSLRLDNTDLENQSSFRFYQFIAAVESNFGIKLSNINDIETFRDLCVSAEAI